MQKTCKQCAQLFEITQEDLAFYDKISPVFAGKKYSIPVPTLCYFCRMIRRLSFRKERWLYNRTCDLSGKQMVSAYPRESIINRRFPQFPVYSNDEWWSDKWDAKIFGRSYEFSKPFFDQFFALQALVPRMSLIQQKPMENSVYCNAASRCKNCYLIFSANQNEDCYYASWINYSKDCVDNLSVQGCELCYDCITCTDCYHCFFSQEAKNCTDCYFVKNCLGCKDCFMSVNLVQKQYCIFNKQYSKEEYFKKLKSIDFGSREVIKNLKLQFKEICQKSVVKYYVGAANENSTGNYLNNTKNCLTCFEFADCEDASYSMNINKAKNVMDYSHWGENAEMMYECQACGYDVYNMAFCNLCWSGCNNLLYCDNCFSSQNCFACVGLRKDSYCILNRQYTKSEYEDLVPRIIEHMKKTPETASRHVASGEPEQTGGYGEFFPEVYSPFAYNESLAYEHLPLSKEDVLARGWQWLDRNQGYEYQGPKVNIPDNIKNVPDDITQKILTCSVTGNFYKVIPKELKFYKEQNLAVPDKSPDQRHLERLALRNPRRLWDRACVKCKAPIKTSYAPERPEIVYCEACYLKEVY